MEKTTKILVGAIIVLAVGLIFGCGTYYVTITPTSTLTPRPVVTPAPTPTPAPAPIDNSEKNAGIIIFSPKPNQAVTTPLTITGQVTGKNNWVGFEGQAGTVKLLDENANLLASGVLQATSDWMQFPVNFKTILNFDTSKINGFNAKEGKMVNLVFYNENPSGNPTRSEIYDSLTIKIFGSANNQMNVSVSFPNNQLDPNMLDCSKVFETKRVITKTSAVGRSALEELFKGPTDQEKKDGYFTNIPLGVKIQKLTIENGLAKVDLNEKLEQGVGGSCRVDSIRAQITETLKQFPTIQNVVISIDGRTEDILQP